MTILQRKLILAAFIASTAIGTAYAQSNETPRIDQREANQQKRIDQGVKSGELTNKEANTLQRRQDRVNAAEANAKADGKVTPQERRKLRRMENRNSKAIYNKKHNERKAPSAAN
jgi:tellurite resistance protein